MSDRAKRLVIAGAILIGIFLILRIWAKIYPDWLWFKSDAIGQAAVFWTMLKSKLFMGIGFGFLLLILTLGNFYLIWRFALSKAFSENEISLAGGQIALGRNLILVVVILVCLVFSFIAGVIASHQWEPYLRFVHSGGLSFGHEDPIFHKDVAYYVFKMPFLRFIRGILFVTFLFLTLITGVLYALFGGSSGLRSGVKLSMPLRSHLFGLCGITLFLLAWGRRFSMYELLTAQTTVRQGWEMFGVRYVDHIIRIPVQWILMFTAIISGIAFIASIFWGKLTRISIGGVALFVIVSLIGGLIVPWVVQRLKVEPDERVKEEKYIGYNIDFTRQAYNLDRIETKPYPETGELRQLTLEDITENKAIMQNIRLWDWRPLRKRFVKNETRRPQYDFVDVDIDRYDLNGEKRQVMLSARELIFSKAPNQTWVNRTFRFTHGYGLTMVPVSEIEDGEPRMYIDNIPPRIHDPWIQEITRSEIYYGEGERVSPRSEISKLPYVIVNPDESIPAQEFDYPGEPDVLTRYEGIGGVTLSGFWRKFAYALKFSGDMRLILFADTTDNSRILLNRSVSERVRAIAPFLKYDKDPYLVVSEEGKLYWIQDAYTTTHMYPYSAPMMEEITEVREVGQQRSERKRRQPTWGNYIRNSVKVVIDAYNGTVTYYRMPSEKGQEDPIAECYSRMFPTLFKDFSDMPADLKEHIRYPLTMFMIQANKYIRYHMIDPGQFYSGEDLWQVGTEKYQTQAEELSGESSGEQPIEPYYVILQLPGSEKEEFMLMLPFTPSEKPTMIAWMAAKCDPDEDGSLGDYGNLLVYNFPKGEQKVDGPILIESYIDQNDEISGQFTLWDTSGSKVLRGNLLAIPLKESMLYVEPIFLEAEALPVPELKRVVVAENVIERDGESGKERRLAWAETLDGALEKLYGSPTTLEPGEGTQPTVAEGAQTDREFLRQFFKSLIEQEKEDRRRSDERLKEYEEMYRRSFGGKAAPGGN